MIVTIDGRVVRVTLRWRHWLPRLWGVGAVTLGRVVVIRGDTIEPLLLAHELVHVAQRQRLGLVRYLVTAAWQWVRYRRHGDRPIEQQANADQWAVLDQSHPTIRAYLWAL